MGSHHREGLGTAWAASFADGCSTRMAGGKHGRLRKSHFPAGCLAHLANPSIVNPSKVTVLAPSGTGGVL